MLEHANGSTGSKKMQDGNENPHLPLHRAALHGDWLSFERFLENDTSALTGTISGRNETALFVAVGAGHSIEFVQKLVEKMPADSVAIPNMWGDNPLHNAAYAGNIEAAKILVEKNPCLTQARNFSNNTPLHVAAAYAHKETVLYLLSVTLDEYPSPFDDKDGARLMISLILAGFYGIAIDLLKYKPILAQRRNDWGYTALDMLAKKPQAFATGSGFGRVRRLLIQYINSMEENRNKTDRFPIFIQDIQNTILIQKQAKELLRLLLFEATKAKPVEADNLVGNAALIAVESGITEFVEESINACPTIIFCQNLEGHNIFLLAVKYRQEMIFNLLHQMGKNKFVATAQVDYLGNNMLHLAAKLSPSNKISGATLQMQRELQWFKEVEKFVQPAFKELKNNDRRTPRMLFTEEHEKLLEKGEKWMKNTATSCATVAALIVTVVFAAAFTVPGGNIDNEGTPIYLNQTPFMVFAIADALALFSSSTSLLMFLGILTSRYAEEDFVKALPMRMSIGLITLFCSIASMLAAFCASFYLVLFHRVNWIAVPIGLVACAPVTLFALLQFPLLIEIVHSTFGPSIFGKQSNQIIL
ncbi:ankyrin repeat-containing protein At5g02620-like isoform X2 [Euphorbia lathyris]|uniref:ankyrin repeat-containing protein At5g02620-like isoform X2 n=1 Tax=Euphorbia lathyris TaxID=212925 RepID=UPI003313B5D2